ncbi:MAG: hypothetical protein GTN81_12305 [Proteobacteria bacterium]|nr:hypothetical protein [Pseudomonadota bacterium]
MHVWLLTLLILTLGVLPVQSRAETPDYLGLETPRTPYDSKYRKVSTLLASAYKIRPSGHSPSFSSQEKRIRQYLEIAQSFSFKEERRLSSGREEDYWQLPEETERIRSGDCEDLAIWLYYHLLHEGFHNVRFTVGYAGAEDKGVHAWVTWYEKGRTYILDPSRREGIYSSHQLGSITYQPWYSYYLDKKWNHR